MMNLSIYIYIHTYDESILYTHRNTWSNMIGSTPNISNLG